jgi:hypothetical protein
MYLRKPFLALVAMLLLFSMPTRSQFLMDMVDTTKDMGKGMLNIYKQFSHIRMSGYFQPQYQVASEKGIKTYNGGDFAPDADNRFMIRRGRVRIDYVTYTKLNQPSMQFVFQFDGTERGVNIRDMWGRVWENKLESFAFTTGMFARPFGFEINLSSSDREAPERGRASQILMKTERDLGIMTSYEPRGRKNFLKYLKIDLGVFNGQGLAGPIEFDGYKDLISQIYIKQYPVGDNNILSGGASILNGGLVRQQKYAFTMGTEAGKPAWVVDSSESNLGAKAPRKYYGFNGQFRHKGRKMDSEIRGEFWWGEQSATLTSTETPSSAILVNGKPVPYYTRPFNAAFFMFLQHIVNKKNQVGIKLDWYDPNTAVAGNQIGVSGSTFNQADINYTTLSFGYNHYFNENLKLFLWYEIPTNESTSFKGYESDLSDNVMTCRLQFRF